MPNNDYILRSDALKATCENCTEQYVCNGKCDDTDRLREIPAAVVVEEENILKFYYVRSIDEYWIGRRVDNFYYAEYDSKTRQWVWTHSRHLPWGEHIISTTSLWKEHTYPSKPEEIPFADWLQGFIRKHIAADVEPKRKWISVTEGLPENFVETLVTDGEDVGIAALQGFMDDEVVWCNAYGMDYIDDPDDEDYLPITHWMPIPEPPKGEDNAE